MLFCHSVSGYPEFVNVEEIAFLSLPTPLFLITMAVLLF
jgi:hypothetical protein